MKKISSESLFPKQKVSFETRQGEENIRINNQRKKKKNISQKAHEAFREGCRKGFFFIYDCPKKLPSFDDDGN